MKIKTLALSICIALGGLMLLSGCHSEKDDSRTDTVLLLGNHANSAAPDLDDNFITSAISQSIKSGGTLCKVAVDGAPYTEKINRGLSFTAQLDQYKNDPTQREILLDSLVNSTIKKAQKLPAKTSEVDLLAALRQAGSVLKTSSKVVHKQIIMVDTGLSTAGLDFRNGLLEMPVDKLVAQLKERKEIPDLTDVEVKWLQLPTAPPQASLSQAQLQKLSDIWRAIIEAGGGKLSIQVSTSNEAITQKFPTLPEVSVVPFIQEAPITFQATSRVEFSQPIALDEKTVAFKADSAEYISESEVVKNLQPIAIHLNSHTKLSVLLAGTTAGDTGEVDELDAKRLSLGRANAVKETLLILGVSEKKLKTVGCGIDSPWHISGLGLSSSEAGKNRIVVLLDVESEIAKQLEKG